MNLPNKLTVSRFGLTVLFLWAVFSKFKYNNTLALFFFGLAGLTDILDGRIARARGLITNFGILMDPLADKIMTCSAFIAFVESTHLNPAAPVKVGAWLVVLFVARELAITGLRLLAASKNIVLAAERFGKHKTISQMVTIIIILLGLAAREDWNCFGVNYERFNVSFSRSVFGLMLLTVGLTLVSGIVYFYKNGERFLSDA